MAQRRLCRLPRGIRLRTTVAATVVVALALLSASVALVLLQRQQLIDGRTEVAKQQIDTIAEEIDDRGLDAVNANALKLAVGDAALLQILGPDGAVLLSTDDDYSTQPITARTPPPDETTEQTVPSLPDDAEPFVVVARGVRTDDGVVRVVAAQSLDSVREATGVLVALLSVGAPLVLLILAGTTYAVVGRALAPVEAIRRRVAEVTTADQDTRVPVPDSADEIARLAETMNAMLARLQAAAVAQHQFVADASHELRTPLATIRTTTELATLHPEAMDLERASTSILTETHRLERLVSDLLLLARSDERGLIMHLEDVDLDDIVTGEIARFRAKKTLTVVVDVVSVRVRGDAQHLLRAVRNLMDNAAKFASTRVEVRLGVSDGTAQLTIADDGPGIEVSERERVFERFVRLDESRERGTGGTGLGLAITRQIALAHAGDVRAIAPEFGTGARVQLSLPLPQAASRAVSPQ